MTDLTKLRELVEKMTPGPWSVWDSCSFRRITAAGGPDGGVMRGAVCSDGHPDLVGRRDDLDGVCALRNAAPALFDELEQARAHLASEHEARLEAEEELAERKANPLLCVSSTPGAHDQEACAGCEPCQLRAQVAQLTEERDKARAKVGEVSRDNDRLRSALFAYRADNYRLRELLEEARNMIVANRLVLGEYQGPRAVSRLTTRIDAELAKDKPAKEGE